MIGPRNDKSLRRRRRPTPPTPKLRRLNQWSFAKALKAFLFCCGSRRWAQAMASHRPYSSARALLRQAKRRWDELSRADWLEAFAAHPMIGGQTRPGRTSRWSHQEQARARDTSLSVRRELKDRNRRYQRRYGHIFLICVTGKTTPQVLAALRKRLLNGRPTELRLAALEERKIARLRLANLLAL